MYSQSRILDCVVFPVSRSMSIFPVEVFNPEQNTATFQQEA